MKSKSKEFRKSWVHYRKILLILFLLQVLTLPVFAGQIQHLGGHARLIWKKGKHAYRFDQVVDISCKDKNCKKLNSTFETLDDFGNTVLRLALSNSEVMLVAASGQSQFVPSSHFDRLIALPLSQEEFLSYLLYRSPSHSEKLKITYGKQGEVVHVEKKGKKSERYEISYSNFKNGDGFTYPQQIKIVSGKTKLDIEWEKLSLK